MDPYDILIYGSCVSRDSAIAFPATWTLTHYSARQSFISTGSTVHDPHLTQHHFPSPFQDRMFHSDLAGNALDLIDSAYSRATHTPVLLIDLIDERFGIYTHANSAAFTRSYELMTTTVLDHLSPEWEHHPFASLSHAQHFMAAEHRVRTHLQRTGLWDNTRIIEATWATQDDNGNPPPTSMGLDSTTANQLYADYYDYLREKGWTVLTPQAPPIASTSHQWGRAPFHYTRQYYESIVDAISASLP